MTNDDEPNARAVNAEPWQPPPRDWVDYATAAFAFLAALGGIAAAIFTFWQASTARNQLALAQDTEQRQLRAYVFPTDGWSADVGTAQPARASLNFKNSGQTPAYDLTVREHFAGTAYPLQKQLEASPTQETKAVLGPGATFHVTMTAKRAVTADELVSINLGKSAFYLYGNVDFTDAFGQHSRTLSGNMVHYLPLLLYSRERNGRW